MPSAGSNKVLTPDEIATLERWIEEGGEYQPHWAFVVPEKAPLPTSPSSNRTENEIDRFAVDRLRQVGLSPSEEADPETLINRVSLDLDRTPTDAGRSGRVPQRYQPGCIRGARGPASGLGSLRRTHGAGVAGRSALCRYRWFPARFSQFGTSGRGGTGPFRRSTGTCLSTSFRPGSWPGTCWPMVRLRTPIWRVSPANRLWQRAFLRLNRRTSENGSIHEEWRVEADAGPGRDRREKPSWV